LIPFKLKSKHLKQGELEAQLSSLEICCVGVDEVGRGCIAGPVVTAAVCLDAERFNTLVSEQKALIRDSKKLSPAQREKARAIVLAVSRNHALGLASVREIEELGIVPATFLAMRRAVSAMQTLSNDGSYWVLVDGTEIIPELELPQMSVVKGDGLCFCIAAASILAKTHRDELMESLATKHPNYGFETHVGYGTADHIRRLNEFGPCEIHRRNFAPISSMVRS